MPADGSSSPQEKGNADLSAPTNSQRMYNLVLLYQRQGIHRLFFSSRWLGRLAKEKSGPTRIAEPLPPVLPTWATPLLPSSASGPAANKHFHPTHNKAKFAWFLFPWPPSCTCRSVVTVLFAHPGLVLYCGDSFSSEPALAAPEANHRDLVVTFGMKGRIRSRYAASTVLLQPKKSVA